MKHYSPHGTPERSARQPAVPGIHPDYFSKISNRVICALLNNQSKPWPDDVVRLYIHALVSFGSREFSFKTTTGMLIDVILEPGELTCSIRHLSGMAGRTRARLSKIIITETEKVRVINNCLPVYRLKGGKTEPGYNRNSSRVVSPDISKNSADTVPPKVTGVQQKIEPLERENFRESEKKEKVAHPNNQVDHATHDPLERRSGRTMVLGNCLPMDRSLKKFPEVKRPMLSKDKAMKSLAGMWEKLPGDQLVALMNRYNITHEEMKAACAQRELDLKANLITNGADV